MGGLAAVGGFAGAGAAALGVFGRKSRVLRLRLTEVVVKFARMRFLGWECRLRLFFILPYTFPFSFALSSRLFPGVSWLRASRLLLLASWEVVEGVENGDAKRVGY